MSGREGEKRKERVEQFAEVRCNVTYLFCACFVPVSYLFVCWLRCDGFILVPLKSCPERV
jgi:hypothetical protein